jgi:uncharacterized protein GlcG (DUF336 family)
MRAITLRQANTIIEFAFERVSELGLKPLSIILLDAGGRVKAFQKQDGAALLRFEIAYGKAFAALGLGRSSKLVLQKYREKPKFMENLERLSDGPIFLEGGAQLILDEHGEVVGAVGITGDTNEKDDDCAFAGIRGAGFHVDENQYEGDGP